MGYNLYINVYLQDRFKIISNTKWISDISLSVAWLTLNFNLAKVESKFSRKKHI